MAATESANRVLQDLAWEQLANELEDWLDAGHRPPLPAGLDNRPASTPPAHLERRLVNLTTRLSMALREMNTERDGLETSIRATAQAQRASAAGRRATPSYLDANA
ncbi:MAG: hypothetical protein QJR09_03045 [Micrococcus sp.]|nr:hypothetical protein [Micrococcus sp.]